MNIMYLLLKMATLLFGRGIIAYIASLASVLLVYIIKDELPKWLLFNLKGKLVYMRTNVCKFYFGEIRSQIMMS